MPRTTPGPLAVAALTAAALTACAGTTTDELGCTSRYDAVVTAPTWAALRAALLDGPAPGRARSVRIQARGAHLGVDKRADAHVVRVVDVLGPHGRRLRQVDVWRTPTGGWRAGTWSQCID